MIPGVGHMPHLEAPNIVRERIREHVTKLERALPPAAS
jgi:pimeloyl-ACP methyl ester carboxylesterase